MVISVKKEVKQKKNKKNINKNKKTKYEEIKNTGKIEHKTLGEGVVKRISGDTIEVEFENRTSKMKLKFLMEKDLLR